MRPTVFRALRDLAYQQAGISLGEEKLALVSARVGKRLRALKLDDEEDYLRFLAGDDSGAELVEFLDVISTNFTSFFREPAHFSRLEAHVTRLVDAGQRRLRVWCAASSSGEEPYTLALVLAGLLEGKGVDWKVLATDISTRVLGLARRGHYTRAQLKAVPREALARWFTPTGEAHRGEPLLAVKDALRQQVTFARLNLARPPYPMKGPFDAIFCRNVMIYFDAPVRQGLTSELERLAAPGALVVVGHAETLSGLKTSLKLESPSVYRAEGAR